MTASAKASGVRSTFTAVVLALACLLALAAPGFTTKAMAAVFSTPRADTWGTNGTVYAVQPAADGGVYIGGRFSSVAPTSTGSGAVLNTSDALLASHLQVTGGAIETAIADGSGGYYIGGGFTAVGGVGRNCIAHILADGTLDLSWNPNANSYVKALAVDGSTVYVGGYFSTIGGAARRNIAALDASAGSTGTATAWDPSANTIVMALAVDGSTVYAGGDFTTIGGATRNYIAALDASAGSTGTATAWNPNANASVYTLAVDGSTVYAGGNFWTIGGAARNDIAALDASAGSTGTATAWNPNANSGVRAIAVDGSTVYVGGYFTTIGGATRSGIAALDAAAGATGTATAWNPNSSDGILALAVDGSTVYAAGNFTSATIGGATRSGIAALDASAGSTGTATAWNPRPDGMVLTLATDGSTIYAGGRFTSLGAVTRNNLAKLKADGTLDLDWDPNAGDAVYALAVDGSTVYAGGDFRAIGGEARGCIAALNASAGSTGTATAWNPNANASVYTLAVDGSTVYAGGGFRTIGGAARNYIAALDNSTGAATAWDPNASGPGGEFESRCQVNALAVDGSTVYAGGNFSTIGGAARNYIAALDNSTGAATAWDPNASGPVAEFPFESRSAVCAIAVDGSTVYAAGEFTNIGGVARNNLAALDASVGSTGTATAWNPGAGGAVRVLAVDGSTVYAGGDFTTIGSVARNNLAALDASVGSTGTATAWDPNANYGVNALAIDGSTLYASGSFTTVGGMVKSGFAAFEPAPYTVAFVTDGTPGSWVTSSTQTVLEGMSAAAVTAMAPANYHFVNWTGTGGFTPTIANPLTLMNVTADITLTANYAIDEFTVTFDSQSGSEVSPVTGVDYDTALGAGMPADPTREHYTFAGWNTAADGTGTAFDAATHVTGDVTVYAMWTIDTYTLTYSADPHGSVEGSATQVVDYNTSGIEVQAKGITGYHFVKWSDDVMTAKRTDADVKANVTVEAQFAIDTHTLTYTADTGGSIDGSATQVIDYDASGSEVAAHAGSGYRFLKWSNESTINPRTDAHVTDDATYTALFEPFAARPDTFTAQPNETTIVTAPGVLANDANVTAVELITGTEHGDVVLDSTGGFVYTPDMNYSGTDTFTYRGSDSGMWTESATVTITVLPRTYQAIEGTVTVEGAPLSRIVVAAFDAANDRHQQGVFTDANGRYRLWVPSGYYHLRFTRAADAQYAEAIDQYYRHVQKLTDAPMLRLLPAEALVVSDDLTPIAKPVASITGTITASGLPLERIVVTAYDSTTHRDVKGVFTNASGAYSITGIPAGTYHVRFGVSSPASMTQYFDHKVPISEATVLTLTAGGTLTVSSDLAPAATQTISGTITNSELPMSRIVVTAFDATTHAYVKATFTNASGVYSISGIPAGTYHLRFTGTTPSNLTQFYDHQARIGNAAPLSLDPGATLTVTTDLSGPIAP
ncbi:MAG: cadherin-like domain-containing protein [Coriobacteriia bacterium]|nr:cadherin-like domain-containing protein [Coriobacteriia bacterium]